MPLAQQNEFINKMLHICSPLFKLGKTTFTIFEVNTMYQNISFLEFQQRFNSEEKCWNYLVNKRWPNGFICPVCRDNLYYFIQDRKLFQCQNCHFQASVTANTIFHKTRTPLQKWFWAIYLVAQQKKGISATQLKKFLSFGSYKTAWAMIHKIRKAMATRDASYQLSGLMELDDTYVGSKRKTGKRGRGASNKTIVLAGIEVPDNKKPKFAMLEAVKNLNAEELKPRFKKRVKELSIIKTDGYSSFSFIPQKGYYHFPKVLKKTEIIQEHLPWVHILIANFKNTIRSTFHGVSSKYLQRYLDEFTYRFNRRFWEPQLFDRLLFACTLCKKISLAELRA
jgi:transposase-like protein